MIKYILITSEGSWLDPKFDLAVLKLVFWVEDADSEPVCCRVFLLVSVFLNFFAKASFHLKS